jgi:hypothetical protein
MQDGEPSPADLWQMQLEKRAQELKAFVCLVGNMDKQEEGGEQAQQQQQQQQLAASCWDGGVCLAVC